MRGALAWLIAGGMAAGLVMAPIVMQPDPFANLGKRFLFPWADIERVSRFVVELAPGDKVVAAGTEYRRISDRAFPVWRGLPQREAFARMDSTDGKPHRVPMAADAEATPGRRAFDGEPSALDRLDHLPSHDWRGCQPAASDYGGRIAACHP